MTMEQVKTLPASKIQKLSHRPEIKAYIDYALSYGRDGLIVVGWLYDPDSIVTGIGLLVEGRRNHFSKKFCELRLLAHGMNNVFLERIHRHDVGEALQGNAGDKGDKHGFVLVVPCTNGGKSLAFETVDGRVVTLPLNPLTDEADIVRALDACRPQYGEALSAGMKAVFGNDDLLWDMQKSAAGAVGWKTQMKKFSTVDHVILLESRYLIISGWIARAGDTLDSVTLAMGKRRIDITQRIRRYMRKDLFLHYPWSVVSEALGFMGMVDELNSAAAKALITINMSSGDAQTHECPITRMDWNSFSGLVCKQDNDFSLTAIRLLDELQAGMGGGELREKLLSLRSDNLHARYVGADTFIDKSDYIFASVDRGIPLGTGGLLVFGWYLVVGCRPGSIKVYDEKGRASKVEMISLLRRDVVDAYRERLPGATAMCGFVCLAPQPTYAGDARILAFDFGNLGETWMKIPTGRPAHTGIDLARDMIGMIPEPMSLSHALYDLFDRALGPAIKAVTGDKDADVAEVMTRQFGAPPETAECSVIVPLYGRCDFMRFQLSQFADDPEFARCDLIYVIDEPRLVHEVLALASRFQPLFGVPFRVLWYDENRGFAGANNIGVRHARTDRVVLMNSDVLPQQPGWLGTLGQALDTLDGAGAVGPLLQFADGSIQHAGMRPYRDAALPGFLLNTHVQMGTEWEGGDRPAEQVMLTAACLMLSRENYLSAGGLDEGYLVGDFEDSDLCLSLRKRGYRLWLVPAARLWHLERQSVNLQRAAASRQLITLYNGWRYRQKILQGELIDPCDVEVAQ